MAPAQQEHSRIVNSELDHWFATDLGKLVLGQEREVIAAFAGNMFGYHLLEVGNFRDGLSYLEACAVQRKIQVGPEQGFGSQRLRAYPEQLPVATDSIDAVILPHTLDFALDPRQVLRESERVLIPQGQVIITGFNPFSIWGMRRLFPGARRRIPWKGHFISYPRLQDWLSLLGFDVERVATKIFRPPLQRESVMAKLHSTESMGQRLWPWAAAVYVVQAVKRVSTVTPVRPRWRLERKIRNRAVEPSAREIRNG